MPDLGNVARVEIPANVTVNFAPAGAVAPAIASQAVNLDSLTGPGPQLNVVDGRLNVLNGLQLAAYTQSGGTVATGGSLTVTQNFQQSGGLLDAAGTVSIAQASGGTVLGNIRTRGRLDVVAQGDISQIGGSRLVVGGATSLLSSDGSVRLNSSGNSFASAPTLNGIPGEESTAQATAPGLAIADAQRMAAHMAGKAGMTRTTCESSGGLSHGLVLVEAADPTAMSGRDAAGFLRLRVLKGGIQLPQGLMPAETAGQTAPR